MLQQEPWRRNPARPPPFRPARRPSDALPRRRCDWPRVPAPREDQSHASSCPALLRAARISYLFECKESRLNPAAAAQPPERGHDPLDEGVLQLPVRLEIVPNPVPQRLELGDVFVVEEEIPCQEPVRGGVSAWPAACRQRSGAPCSGARCADWPAAGARWSRQQPPFVPSPAHGWASIDQPIISLTDYQKCSPSRSERLRGKRLHRSAST